MFAQPNNQSQHNLPINILARRFWDMGVNVVPAYALSKTAFKAWGYAKVTGRLPRFVLGLLFSVSCNIALITGKTSQNMFGFDLDDRATFLYIIERCEAAGLPIYAAWSGGEHGGGHVYFKCSDGVIASLREGQLKHLPKLGIRSEGQYLIGPGSRLSTGTYRLYEGNTANEIPTITLAQTQQVLPEASLAKKSFRTKARASQQLHPGTATYLAGCSQDNHYHTHLFAAACDLSASGMSQAEIMNQLFPIAEQTALSPQERHQMEYTIQRATQKQRLRGVDMPNFRSAQGTKAQPWEQVAGWLKAQPLSMWKGKSGATDFKMMHALIERCRLDENPYAFRASVRELADEAKVWPDTAFKSLERLMNRGLLQKVMGVDGKPMCAENSQAHLYRFSRELASFGLNHADLPESSTSVSTLWLEQHTVLVGGGVGDLAETKALGGWGTLLYTTLKGCTRAFSPKELVSITGLSERQIRHLLPVLERAGLVYRDTAQRGCWRVVGLSEMEVVRLPVCQQGRVSRTKRHRQILQDRECWLVAQMLDCGMTQLNAVLAAQFREEVWKHRHWLREEGYISNTLYWTLEREVEGSVPSVVTSPAVKRCEACEVVLPENAAFEVCVGCREAVDAALAEVAAPVTVTPTLYCHICGSLPLFTDPLPESCLFCQRNYRLHDVLWISAPPTHKLPRRRKRGEDPLAWYATEVLGAKVEIQKRE